MVAPMTGVRPHDPGTLVHLAALDATESGARVVAALVSMAGATRLELMALLWDAQTLAPRHSPERGVLGDVADALLGQVRPEQVLRLPGDPPGEMALLAAVAADAARWSPAARPGLAELFEWLGPAERDADLDWRWLAAHSTTPWRKLPVETTPAALAVALAEAAQSCGVKAPRPRLELARQGVRRGRYEVLTPLEPERLWASLVALSPGPSWLAAVSGPEGPRAVVGFDVEEHALVLFARSE